ncbi:MAG TPA: PDZ domain-containing protein, partial [Vicinamibacterales bacterium]
VFRVAAHHTGTDAELDAFTRDVESIVKEARNVFGEFPTFEGNTYTFIADYLPWANGDGMEHRNSTILTSSGSLAADRADLLDTVSHEFFHAWNVERLRPADLEPFDFGDANVSELLWFAEGFTSYYGPLALARAGLVEFPQTVTGFGRTADAIITGSGRSVRSAVEMSRHAPFVDAAASIDRNDIGRTFISYYTWGAGIAFGLDLTLRQRSGNTITLDDYMRRLWTKYGKTGRKAPGFVARPYTLADLRLTLGEVAGDQKFADDFFARYIQGREAIDYAKLMDQAGLVLRPARAGAGWIGDFGTEAVDEGLRVTSLVPFGTPAYAAGIDQDDLIVAVNGQKPSGALVQLARAMKPGAVMKLTIRSRGGAETARDITVAADPHVEIVPVEAAGGTPTAAQKAFRESWLGVRLAARRP